MDVRTVSTLHTKDARAEGETKQRLYAVMVWEATPFFTEHERAALAWTEAVTLVGQGHASDDICQLARGSFSENDLVNPDPGNYRHQRMEPIGDQFSHPTWTYQRARQNI